MASVTTTKKDPIAVAPEVYTVLLENDQVRVLDIRLKAGQKSAEHSHPAIVIYAVNGGKAKFTYPDGRSEEIEFQPNQTVWSDAVTHSVENIGSSDMHVLNIEFKE